MSKVSKKIFQAVCILSLLGQEALAKSNQNMVWEQPAAAITESIKGPVAMAIGTIAIVIAGLAWAFTDGGNLMGKAIKIVIGIVLAFGVGTFMTGVLGAKAGFLFF